VSKNLYKHPFRVTQYLIVTMHGRIVLVFILALTTSILILVRPEYTLAQTSNPIQTTSIPISTPLLAKPLVPEFAVKIIVSPPEVNKTIELTIKNQPFVPYYDSNSGWNISLYYNVRVRVNNGNWSILYLTEDVPVQSNGESTILLYPSDAPDSEYQYFLGDKLLDLFLGDQVDFQVQAMIGYIYRVQQGNFAPYYFAGETSNWSNTQTIIISTSASSSTPTESQSPSSSLTPPPSISEFPSWTILSFATVAILLAVAVVKRKNKKIPTNC
jgi:hypothetical protein